ncbi:MAG: hypothetical protein GX620_09545 [Chloroflexi bacterium]|nr:hypothetical protein [Chloroflexota bacterium]
MTRVRLNPWMIVLALAVTYVGFTLARYGGDPMAFAMVGTRFATGDPEGTAGYDGQFAYYIARAPLEGWRYCDVPAYRYQRILYPILAWVLSAGQPNLVPWALIGINIAALTGGAYFTERLLLMLGANRWYSLVYGLYGGLIAGLRLNLTEPLAYGLVQAGLWAWAVGKRGRGMVLFLLAALAKEMALVAVGGVVLSLVLERRWRAALACVTVIGVPYVAWQSVLWAWLGSPGVGSGGAMATPFEWLPFAGFVRVALVSLPAFLLLLAIEGPLFVAPAIWAVAASLRQMMRRDHVLWVTVLLAQGAVLAFLPFSSWREPLAMARIASGLMSSTILFGAWRRSPRTLRFSTVWLATLALLANETVLPV